MCGMPPLPAQSHCLYALQVSTPGLQAAHHYIWQLTQQLQSAAEARGDVIVQTAFENYTGSNDFDFVVGSIHQLPGCIPQMGLKASGDGCCPSLLSS